MSDRSELVERLRNLRHIHQHQSFEVVAHTGEEAAAEIERIEAMEEAITQMLEWIDEDPDSRYPKLSVMGDMLRAALARKESK